MVTFAGRLARAVTPRSVKRFLREHHRSLVLHRAMRRITADPESLTRAQFDYTDLIYGWGNEGCSASSRYLGACIAAARAARGPILECGSGLSTLLLGAIGKPAGATVWSLEHDPDWARRVMAELDRYGLDSVRLCVNPLRNYGSFHWYAPPMESLPADFALVVCDGPPGGTPGGRQGMLPIMRSRLRPGCVVLLDDAHRSAEQSIATQWARELGTTMRIMGDDQPYIELRIPVVD